MDYKITVPVTSYHEVKVSRGQLIDMLKKEARSLCNGYESIISHNGKRLYYIAGYGSHDVGEKYGPEAPEEVVVAYDKLWATIIYLNDKIREEEK